MEKSDSPIIPLSAEFLDNASTWYPKDSEGNLSMQYQLNGKRVLNVQEEDRGSKYGHWHHFDVHYLDGTSERQDGGQLETIQVSLVNWEFVPHKVEFTAMGGIRKTLTEWVAKEDPGEWEPYKKSGPGPKGWSGELRKGSADPQ